MVEIFDKNDADKIEASALISAGKDLGPFFISKDYQKHIYMMGGRVYLKGETITASLSPEDFERCRKEAEEYQKDIEKKCTLCGDIIKFWDEYFSSMKLDEDFKPIKEGVICMKCYENLSEKEKSEYSIVKKVIIPSGLSGKELADFIVENM